MAAGDANPLAVDSLVGPYRLGRVLGEGASGVVWYAVRVDDGREVALKVIKMELAADETYRRRLAHEVRAAKEVAHRNVVPLVDSGTANGVAYIAFAYAEGLSLRDRLQDEGPLPLDAVIRLANHIASGLDAVHAQGILHRDVKPANVVVTATGNAMLTDFGLAKGRAYTVLTPAGRVLGSAEYIAPELIRGETATTASDIYAFGCTVFECVAGRSPFSGRSLIAIGVAHLREEPPDPCAQRTDCPGEFGAAVRHALAKDPAERPRTAIAYARLLGAAARVPKVRDG